MQINFFGLLLIFCIFCSGGLSQLTLDNICLGILSKSYVYSLDWLPRLFVYGGKMGTILKRVPKLDKVNSFLVVCISVESRGILDCMFRLDAQLCGGRKEEK